MTGSEQDVLGRESGPHLCLVAPRSAPGFSATNAGHERLEGAVQKHEVAVEARRRRREISRRGQSASRALMLRTLTGAGSGRRGRLETTNALPHHIKRRPASLLSLLGGRLLEEKSAPSHRDDLAVAELARESDLECSLERLARHRSTSSRAGAGRERYAATTERSAPCGRRDARGRRPSASGTSWSDPLTKRRGTGC